MADRPRMMRGAFQVESGTRPDEALHSAKANEGALAAINREIARRRLAAEDAQRGPVGHFMKNFADGTVQLASGIPLAGGLVDEGNALIRSGGGLLGDYGQALEYERERQEQAQARSPLAHGVNTLAGTVGGGLAMVPAKVVQGGGPLLNMGKGALAGSVGGAVEGFTRGEGGYENRKNAMPASALLGGAAGAFGPMVASGLGRVTDALFRKRHALPSGADISDAFERAAQEVKDANLQFGGKASRRIADEVVDTLEDRGLDKTFAEATRKEHQTMPGLANFFKVAGRDKGSLMLSQVQKAQKIAADSRDPTAPRIANLLHRLIDDATEEDFIGSNIKKGVNALREYQDKRLRSSRAIAIDDAKHRALNEAGDNFLPNRYAESYRKELKKISDSDEFKRWPEVEKGALDKAVQGGPFHNALRNFGEIQLPGGLSGGLVKIPLGIPLGLGKALARHTVAKIDLRNAKAAETLIKTGKLPEQTPQAKIVDELMRRIMMGQSGQIGEWISSDAER